MMSETRKKEYDLRFRHFIRHILCVSRMNPREKYLYPIMDGVPFKDLETAILMAHLDWNDVSNDNQDKA